MKVVSIQIGKVVTEGDPTARDVTKKRWSSAFDKRPVIGPVAVGDLGIEGDQVADHKHHGGVDKAILCYSIDHYQQWQIEHPELGMSPGGFGENLTIQNQTETEACIGDRYRVGTCEIEVSQPRQPCWKIVRRWGVKSLTKEVGQTGRTGWYARVIASGEISPGDDLKLLNRPNPAWPVARVNDILFKREVDPNAKEELMSIQQLAKSFRDNLA